MPAKRLLLIGLVLAALVPLGCGGDDEDGGADDKPAQTAGGPVKIAEDAQIKGPEGAKIADSAKKLLEARSGQDVCYELTASDYVESLGGEKGCAAKLGPIATGPLDTIVAARAKGRGEAGDTGEAQLESSDGSQKQTVKFAKSVTGDWNVDGLGSP